MTIVFSVLSAVGAIAGIFIFGFTVWRQKQRHRIRWAILSVDSMMDISQEVAKRIEIRYDGQPISKNLSKYTLLLHYTGTSALRKDAIEDPISWTNGELVIDAWKIAQDPGFDPCVKPLKRCVRITWNLLNPGWKAVIGVLCQGSSRGHGEMSGVIENVSHITQQEVGKLSGRLWFLSLALMGLLGVLVLLAQGLDYLEAQEALGSGILSQIQNGRALTILMGSVMATYLVYSFGLLVVMRFRKDKGPYSRFIRNHSVTENKIIKSTEL